MKQSAVLLSLHYLPCVEWFRNALITDTVVIEQHEHFIKQTYRNRTIILSANGPLALSVPVTKNQSKIPVNQVCIDNTVRWQHQHWESIRSAYNSSPYFMYYEHHFEPLYKGRHDLLFEYNMTLVNKILSLLKKEVLWNFTETYEAQVSGMADLRDSIHPKKTTDAIFKRYLQVFAEKYPFQKNLSILDVLFNNGPDSLQYIFS